MREFLKGLELDGELIDTVMAEHGKLLTKSKESASNLAEQLKTAQAELQGMGEKAKAEHYGKLGVKDEKELDELLAKLEAVRQAEAQAEADKPEIEKLRTEIEKMKADSDRLSGIDKTNAELQAQLNKYRLEEFIRSKGVTGNDAKLAAYCHS